MLTCSKNRLSGTEVVAVAMAGGRTHVGAAGVREPTPLARELGFSHLKGKGGAEKGRRASEDGCGKWR